VIEKYKSHIIAALGTLLFMGLVFLLLWFLRLDFLEPVEDEGIVVTFGYAEEGGGMAESSSVEENSDPQIEQIPAEPTTITPSKNEFMVQDSEESLALNKQTEDKKKDAQDEELIRKRKEQEALAEAERKEKERLLAEQKAQQEKIDKANKLGSLFGDSNTPDGGNGVGEDHSTKVQGNPVGKGSGSVGGNNWELAGRDCKSLPKPGMKFNQSGKVVVDITVNEKGEVITVKVGGGSTVSDEDTQKLALDAAKKAKFTPGEGTQKGKIVYIFKFN
jgi:TonB family protein